MRREFPFPEFLSDANEIALRSSLFRDGAGPIPEASVGGGAVWIAS